MDYILKHTKVIITTIVALAILSGVTKIFSSKAGHYVLVSTVTLYLVYRLVYFIAIYTKHKQFSRIDKQYLAIFSTLLAIVIFNNFNLLGAPFISLIFILVDYIITLQQPAEVVKEPADSSSL